MGEGDLGREQRDPVQGGFAEEGRGGEQRMNGGADVVGEAGEREGLSAAAAAGALRALEHVDPQAGPRECQGAGEPVGPGADDDRVALRRGRSRPPRRAHSSSTAPCTAGETAARWAVVTRQLIERLVVAIGPVMEQHDPVRSGPPAELGGVVGGCVPEAAFARQLLAAEQLGVVDQDVGSVGQLERGGMVLAATVRSRSEHGRAVVGDIGDHGVPVADPVAECPPALVRDLARERP